jgi:hypothetical protein
MPIKECSTCRRKPPSALYGEGGFFLVGLSVSNTRHRAYKTMDKIKAEKEDRGRTSKKTALPKQSRRLFFQKCDLVL